ncbi:MAG TPA: bifunctional diaminohydroxyphosphoribosylaminopyrimidine deaminase/5-amino-6-(5-phosphoribosylamino)uracil reductase RibD [Acidimicrobiia bacterium]
MERAAEAAARFRPHPNPRVGAVVLSSGGSVAAVAAHERPGLPHAEVLALAGAGCEARDGTLVVTLEPCSHHGRTPPCVETVTAAGIARVVVGAPDPDPRVSGAGIAALRAAGVQVEVGVPGLDAEQVDPGYFHHRRTGRPLVTLKLAATLDGQTAAADGTSRWITGEEARADAHRLRAASDAVMVGAGTLRTDDPSLDVRLPGFTGDQPRPVVVAGDRPLPAARALYARDPLVYRLGRAASPGAVETVEIPDLDAVVKDLGARMVVDLLAEGGPTLARSLLHAGLVDRFVLYLAGRFAGGVGRPMFDGVFGTLGDIVGAQVDAVTRLGDDIRVTGTVP